MTIKLNKNTFALASQNAEVPSYLRSKISPGILHFGVGNFPRAHMMNYLEDLHQIGEGNVWGVIGASLRQSSATTRDALNRQDCLYTVIELDRNVCSARIMGGLLEFCPINHEIVLQALLDPQIRIVTLCITEGGYFIDAETGGFAINDPDIIAEVADPSETKTIFGLILKALKDRQKLGIPPFTILSLDNLPGNGDLTKQTVVGLAQLMDLQFSEWIELNVSFPNCMVDCIVPATSPRERNLVKNQLGLEDEVPVVCEPFRQWVIEDNFPTGRPPFEKVGVEFVDDITPFELMKLRILNASHASFCYAAAVLGYDYGNDAIDDPDLLAWVIALQKREVFPTLKPLPGVSYEAYLNKVLERFSNPEIKDTIARLAFSGSDRQPKFILPTLRDALDANSSIDGLALELALWCRYCTCTTESNETIELEDKYAAELQSRAIEASKRPKAFLEFTEVFGKLGENSKLTDTFARWLRVIHEKGVRAAITQYVDIGKS